MILCYIFFAKRTSSNGIEKYPQLRFNGYSNPWTTQKLGNLGTFIKGAPLSKADISDEGNPFILYGELYTTYSEVTHSVKRKTDKTEEQQFYSKIGDVIMPTSGETPEDIATASCIMLPDVILAGDLLIYRTEQIDGRFVSYAIKNKVNKQISSVAQGKSVVHVRADELAKICITFPALDEQKKILNLLELLDTRIATQQSLIETLKKYKRGLLPDIFEQRLSFTSETDSAWKEVRLGDICRYRRGSFPQPYGLPEWYDEEKGMPFIQVADVTDSMSVNPDTNRHISDKAKKQSVYIPKGTLIITLQGTIGRVAITPYDAYIDRTLLIIQDIDKNILQEFLMYALYMKFSEEKQTADGSIIKTITKETLTDFFIKVPPIKEQAKIVRVLMSLDTRIRNEEMLLTELYKCKSGLLQQLFI